jgi:hypothetical protein
MCPGVWHPSCCDVSKKSPQKPWMQYRKLNNIANIQSQIHLQWRDSRNTSIVKNWWTVPGWLHYPFCKKGKKLSNSPRGWYVDYLTEQYLTKKGGDILFTNRMENGFLSWHLGWIWNWIVAALFIYVCYIHVFLTNFWNINMINLLTGIGDAHTPGYEICSLSGINAIASVYHSLRRSGLL